MNPADLPFLGLGVSASPNEAALLAREKIAGGGPLSSIGFLNIGVHAASEVPAELPGLLRDASLGCVVHLEDIDLAMALDPRRLDAVVTRCRGLAPSWLQEDLGVWLWNGRPLVSQMIPPILDRSTLRTAATNVRRLVEASGVPFLAENPPMHFALGDLDLLSFMGTLSDETGCGLLLDVGHLVSYCLCTLRDPSEYLAAWPSLDRVVEVHLAGYRVFDTSAGPLWFDLHDLRLTDHALRLLGEIVDRAPNVKAITLETEGATSDVLWSNLERVESRLTVARQDA